METLMQPSSHLPPLWKSWLVVCLIVLTGVNAHARQTLVVAAYPAVDEIVKAAVPLWKRVHPNVDIKVVSRQFGDHQCHRDLAAVCAHRPERHPPSLHQLADDPAALLFLPAPVPVDRLVGCADADPLALLASRPSSSPVAMDYS